MVCKNFFLLPYIQGCNICDIMIVGVNKVFFRLMGAKNVESPGYLHAITYEDSSNPINRMQYVDISNEGGGYAEANLWRRGSSWSTCAPASNQRRNCSIIKS